MRIGFLLIIAVHWFLAVAGQGPERLFQEVSKASNNQAVELRHQGRVMRQQQGTGCDELQAGWALELFAAALGHGEPDLSACLAEVDACPIAYSRLHLFAGFLMYREGNYRDALAQMNLALTDDLVRKEALDSRGGLHALLGEYALAAEDFTALMEYDPEGAPPSLYSNLSGIHLVMQNWDEAIRWTQLGLKRMDSQRQELNASSVLSAQAAEVEAALLCNQLAAATRKGDRELATRTWQEVELFNLDEAKLSNLKSVMEFALVDDRYQIYDYMMDEGRERWRSLGPSDWSELGTVGLLLNPKWERHFVQEEEPISRADSLHRRWNIARALYFLSGAPEWEAPAEANWKAWQSHGAWLALVGSLLLLGLAGASWWKRLQVFKRSRWEHQSYSDFIESFSRVRPGADINWLLDELNRFLSKRRSGIDWSELSDGETEVLLAIFSGKGSKEIAQETQRSPASVYNIRSSIRKKLDIPADVSLENWCSQMDTQR